MGSIIKTPTGETIITITADDFIGFSISDNGAMIQIIMKTSAFEHILEAAKK